jgi:hypothetical protein
MAAAGMCQKIKIDNIEEIDRAAGFFRKQNRSLDGRFAGRPTPDSAYDTAHFASLFCLFGGKMQAHQLFETPEL